MSNIFSKFFMSFGFNKNKYLPAGTEEMSIPTPTVSNMNSNTVKTLASFDLNIERPKYEGAIPEATIKFYPLD